MTFGGVFSGFRPVFDPGGAVVLLDTFDALDPAWTWLLGTGAVSGGALRAATMAVDGYNIIINAELTTNTTGWNTGGGAAIARVDSTITPGVDSSAAGALDKWALKVYNPTSDPAFTWANPGTIPYATYVLSCLAYAPSANTRVNAVRMRTYTPVVSQTIAIEDAWSALSFAITATGTTFGSIYLDLLGNNAADIVYFDKLWLQAKASLAYHTGWAKLDGTFTAGIPFPATGTTPRSLAFRVTDALNYWEVRLLPNTAANDTFIYEHVAGVATLRAQADVDWTSNGTDEIQVILAGDDITVNQKKSGAGSWTLACSYLTMATGLAAAQHGVLLYQTGADQYTYWQAQ